MGEKSQTIPGNARRHPRNAFPLARRGREDLPPRSPHPDKSGSVTQPRSHAELPGHQDTRQGFFFGGGQPCPLPSAPHVSCRSAPAPLRGGQFLLGFLPGIAPVPAGWNGNTRSGLSPALYQEKQRRKNPTSCSRDLFPVPEAGELPDTPPTHLQKQREKLKPTLKTQSSGYSTPTPSSGVFPHFPRAP